MFHIVHYLKSNFSISSDLERVLINPISNYSAMYFVRINFASCIALFQLQMLFHILDKLVAFKFLAQRILH